MLPLWIIDLRKKSDRRDLFQNLLGQIDHVYIEIISKSEEETFVSSSENKIDEESILDSHINNIESADDKSINVALDLSHDSEEEETVSEISIEEKIENDDKKKVEKELYVEGNWWRYSIMADKNYGINISRDDLNPDARKTVELLYNFQTDLVKEGQKFIRDLRESNAHPDIKFNIVVLGDIEEEFTRLVFPSVAGILQKEKGRILPHHIHQGMEIIGMLYIPSNINALDIKMRESMQRTLNEIDVQHKVADMRGYDHMMIYQDVQNRTDCHYPAMTDLQLEEYLFQCIINLYYATNVTHPLLSGTPSAEDFYFSMGATSICYDVENEDIKARHQFGIDFMRNLKSKGDDEKANLNLRIFESDDYIPSSFFDYESMGHLDREEIRIDYPKPHPIKNFFHKYLKRNYYNRYLRDFTRNMMQQIIATIDESTRGALDIIASNAKRKYNDAKKHIYDRLKDIFTDLEANDGGLPTIIDLLKKMQDSFSEKKKSIHGVVRDNFWLRVEQEQVPKVMQDAFMEYHDAYEEDIKLKNGGVLQSGIKKIAVTELNDMLSQEATILSRICRSILLGIMLALAVVPVLNLISPHILNLGRVRRYAEWWSVGLFFLPILLQFISWFRYERKKKNLINNLKAMYLHDAFARVANRIESEIAAFYNKMIALGDRYIKRTEHIRDDIEKGYENSILLKPTIPETTFNQSLLGGKFGRFSLLPLPEAIDTEIKINYIPYKIGEIQKKEYYLFLNQHHNVIMELYKDVDICENLIRRVKENGEEELVTKEQQEKEQADKWKLHLANFQNQLSQVIKDSIVPRLNNSVGEFLVANIFGNVVPKNVLECMVEYSANNGEATSSADLEMADLKTNDKRVIPYVFEYVSTPFKYDQVAKHNQLYKKYLFLTRWRSFEDFPLNRILPMEDFDEHIKRQRVYKIGKEAEAKRLNKSVGNDQIEGMVSTEVKETGKKYYPYPSTLLLWSLAPDDSSAEWFRLLDSDFFAEAYNDKEIYKEILNPED